MRQGGYFLLELVVVLAVLGLMVSGVSTAYDNGNALRERGLAARAGDTLREAVRAFALTHARLPCPDTDGDGWEGGGGWEPVRKTSKRAGFPTAL
ncbi:MAG: hypothetical protein PHS32_05250 [Rhodoferax sp.]|uniref:hypothetical protein n=1 Tax=Rhodoferax sp. TaxID=50421 RepID=UPI0026168887|nr:hypothetical protein [Rhodoferax sp.]MDD5333134.1 hypothetical protein [Rhodoferax sp.]